VPWNVNPKSIGAKHNKYVESDIWKCPSPKSPNGGHHFDIEGSQMECRYCHKVRQINNKGLVIVDDNTEL